MEGYTFFTSDSRPKYTRDILSVLALPDSATYQFRYEKKYLPDELIHNVVEKKLLNGTKSLIAFKSKIDNDFFIVPIRWVTIIEVKRITDFYIIKFEVGNHPILAINAENVNIETICKKSKDFLSKSNSEPELSIIRGYPNLVKPNEEKNPDAWIYIAKQLALHTKFANAHFLRVSEFIQEKTKSISQDTNRYYVCKEGAFYNFNIDYYAVNFPEKESTLNIKVNPDLARLASSPTILLDSRYDSFVTSFQTFSVSGNAFMEIEVFTKCPVEAIPHTYIRFPIKIVKSKNFLLLKILASSIGATLLAIPNLLTKDSHLQLKLACTILGAFILSLGIDILSIRSKK